MANNSANIGTSAPVSTSKPAVWKWYVIYCAVLACIFLLFIFGVLTQFFDIFPRSSEFPESNVRRHVIGVIMLVLAGIPFVLFAIAPFLPKRPWVWIYGIVLIAVGMISCLTAPFAVPLLIFWFKPETKHFFGWL